MLERLLAGVSPEVGRILEAALEKRELCERDASVLLSAEGADFFALLRAADLARSEDNGDDVSFVVTPQHQFHQRLLRGVHVLRLLAPSR